MIGKLTSKNSLLIWSCWPLQKELLSPMLLFRNAKCDHQSLVGIRFEKGCWATFRKNWFGAEQSCYIDYSSGCLDHFFMGNFMPKNLEYLDCGSCLFFSHFCRYCGSIIVACEKIRWFQIWGKIGVKLCKKWLVLPVLNIKRFTQRYCWGKRSCTTGDVKNPVIQWDTIPINWCRIFFRER